MYVCCVRCLFENFCLKFALDKCKKGKKTFFSSLQLFHFNGYNFRYDFFFALPKLLNIEVTNGKKMKSFQQTAHSILSMCLFTWIALPLQFSFSLSLSFSFPLAHSIVLLLNYKQQQKEIRFSKRTKKIVPKPKPKPIDFINQFYGK